MIYVRIFLVLAKRFADRTIVLNAPSKTYNVPGLGCSYAIIPEAGLRKRFIEAARQAVVCSRLNVIGESTTYRSLRTSSWLATIAVAFRKTVARLLRVVVATTKA